MSIEFLSLKNAQAVSLANVPEADLTRFRDGVCERVRNRSRISAFFAVPVGDGRHRLFACLANDRRGVIDVLTAVAGSSFPSLTPLCPQAHWFEREIYEEHGLVPDGHPWLKPIRFNGESVLPGVTEYFEIEGEEVHEVGVGPVHAGIIEPGHFRFQCHGEKVLHLEISLGYQHRGVEKHLQGGPDKRTFHYMETGAGDSSVAHSLAYCQLVESLTKTVVSKEASTWRAIALELERLANHSGDLGALANDVGYLPTSSFCGRIRGDFLNMTAAICGNRFGRGLCVVGGIGHDVGGGEAEYIRKALQASERDIGSAADLLWVTSSVTARFERTGQITEQIAEDIGLVGVVARACGLNQDIRVFFPTGAYKENFISISTCPDGDVNARALVRFNEIKESIQFIQNQSYPKVKGFEQCDRQLDGNSLVISLVEGWRGEICHVALTDDQGKFTTYKIVDPSFHNWFGLAIALRDQQISDFPLCNKSFNLSYCGHDL